MTCCTCMCIVSEQACLLMCREQLDMLVVNGLEVLMASSIHGTGCFYNLSPSHGL